MEISTVPAKTTLEEKFGPLKVKVIYSSRSERVSITRSAHSILTYNIVNFSVAAKKYRRIRDEIVSGKPLAQTIERNGHKVIRVERSLFPFELPPKLRKLFGTNEGECLVKFVDVYIDRKDKLHKYARVIEIYSPRLGLYDSQSMENATIKDSLASRDLAALKSRLEELL